MSIVGNSLIIHYMIIMKQILVNLRSALKNLAIILLAVFVSSFAGATNWVSVSKGYVDTDTIKMYDGYIHHDNFMENSAGFGSLRHYLSAFLKVTSPNTSTFAKVNPPETPIKTMTTQYIFNCKNRSYAVKASRVQLTNGKVSTFNYNINHSSQFMTVFPDSPLNKVIDLVCKYQ